jgi:hypothetical protein
MADFLSGAVSMGFFIAAGFFFRFWRESRDRLFAFFATAFFLMALDHPGTTWIGHGYNLTVLPYIVRLLSYGNFRRS